VAAPGVAYVQITTPLEAADAKNHTEAMRTAIGSVPGDRTYLTGFPALSHDEQPLYNRDLGQGEEIAVPIALLVLLFMFGTLGAVAVPFAFALVTLPAHADDVADFYKGKRVNMIVSYGPGGGYDVYARVLARYIGRHIPGNPTIVVQNMPGAGSLRGANYIYNVAPKDGTAFGTFARNMALLGLLKTGQNVQFDPTKFTWLGSSASFANDAYVLLLRKDAKVKTVEDARRPGGPPILIGSTAEGASSDAMGVVLREMLGFNVKLIPGYTDSGVLFLAIERGEIEGRTVGL